MTKPTAEQTAFNEIWQAICDIAAKEKTGPLNELEGLFHIKAGPWKLWVNGHAEKMDAIQPYHAHVERNDWPVAVFSPHGGEFFNGASVFDLRDALKARAAR